jgi:hypothetical protein
MGEVPIQDAVQSLVNDNATNQEKITSLERQINDMIRSFEDQRSENKETTQREVQAMSDLLKEQMQSIRTLTELYKAENDEKLKQMENDRNADMVRVFAKLDEITRTITGGPLKIRLKETKDEEQSFRQNTGRRTTNNAGDMMTPNFRRPYGTVPYPTESETQPCTPVTPPLTLNGVRHSIIISPPSAAPAFHGKHNESPTQFLIRVEEYAESVHAWDRDTLLKGISQFLRDSALEWHCQLRFSPSRPTTWFEFKNAFLAQFNSPVRKARQEQEWHECKQKENETINEFLVRLRALWREQKPKETESDLVKHLFCRMRNDLLNMLGIRRDASLEEVICEVQQIEDVLYRRAKRERLAKQVKQTSSTKEDNTFPKRSNAYYSGGTTSRPYQEDYYQNYKTGRNFQINAITPDYRSHNRNTTTRDTNLQMTMESHFIHESIEDILANKLNLYFVHHQDLPKVVNVITQALNLSTSDFNTSVPLIDIITRLLVRQQIDFAPSVTLKPGSNDNLIGKLMFTSYFAAPDRNESPFSIYELFPIPFKLRNNRVTLAKMPAYLGIEHLSQQFIHWSRDEARFCGFKIMPFCRESPIQRKEYEDDCLYQILTDSILENCRIELFYDKIFIHHIGQYWAISTFDKSQCHCVSTEDLDQHIIMTNKQITLPEMVLIRADDTKILACDRFTIPRRMINIGTPINLIYNASITAVDRTLINLQEALDNNTQWRKLPYLSSELHAILEFLNNTPTPIIHTNVPILANHPLSLVTITIVGILILVVLILIYYISRMKKTIKSKNNLTVMMPSLKQLLASDT